MKPEELASRLVGRARTTVSARFGDLVDDVLWYGAVDIDQDLIVVWVLLSGPADTLPTWYFPGPERPAGIDAELLATIDAVRAVVVECFRGQWPDADELAVGFDSADRVRDNGGWHYFR